MVSNFEFILFKYFVSCVGEIDALTQRDWQGKGTDTMFALPRSFPGVLVRHFRQFVPLFWVNLS